MTTGDRQLVNARMGSLVEDKIALRLPDRGDYALMGLQARKLPDDVPEGRGFRSDTGIELQFARQGILIAPSGITDGELVGVRLPRSSLGTKTQPGRVLANLGDGVLRTVQIPLPSSAQPAT